MKLLCLDTETGGLDARLDALVEVAWVEPSYGDPSSIVLPHSPAQVGEFARKVNGYDERGLADPWKWDSGPGRRALMSALDGATLIGANIGFDVRFLEANGYRGWHYRTLDLEAFALPLVGYVPNKSGEGLALPGLADITDWLNCRSWDIPEPDHTALGDVRTTVAVYNAFTELYARKLNTTNNSHNRKA